MTKIRIPVLAVALTLLVGAAPAAACLSMADAATTEHHPTGCDPSPDAPSATLCSDSGTVIPANGSAEPTADAAGLDAASHPGEARTPDRADGASHVTPRARSAPIHLLHATFLI